MKILNLGRILLPFLIILNLYADVSATPDRYAIYKGESVNITLSATGNAHFPDVFDIAGYKVLGTSSSSSINVVNGQMTKTSSKTFSFKPDKNITVPSFSIEVDGATESTTPFDIVVKEPVASTQGDEFVVELSLDKDELMVGQSAKLSVIFKMKTTSRVDDIRLSDPKLSDFWVENLGQGKQEIDGEYIKMSMNYLIFAQKSGEFEIPPITAAIGVEADGGDPFFGSIFRNLNYKQIYSNSTKIKVNPLPNGLSLYGDFQIRAEVDKKVINAGEPVNFTIRVRGIGNVDDIPSFEIKESNLLVYADDPDLKRGMISGEYGGEFSQKFAIVSESNFTIPSMSFSFYDKNLKESKTIKTDPVNIEVIPRAVSNLNINSDSLESDCYPTEVINYKPGILPLIASFIMGALSFYVATNFKFKRAKRPKKELDIKDKIKRAKTDKELLNLLLPYINKSKKIDEILSFLDENLYKNTNHKIEKKEIISEFLRLEI